MIFVIRRGWGKKEKEEKASKVQGTEIISVEGASLRDKITLGKVIGQESMPALAQDTGGV